MSNPSESEPVARGMNHLRADPGDEVAEPRHLRAAFAAFEERLKQDPLDSRALHGRAVVYLRRARLTPGGARKELLKAQRDLDEILHRDPENYVALQTRGDVQFLMAVETNLSRTQQAKSLRGSIEDFARVAVQFPDLQHVQAALGCAWRTLCERVAGDHRVEDALHRAIHHLEIAISIDPGDHDSFGHLAVARADFRAYSSPAGGEKAAAYETDIARLEEALRRRPDFVLVRICLGMHLTGLASAQVREHFSPLRTVNRALDVLRAVIRNRYQAIELLECLDALLDDPAVASRDHPDFEDLRRRIGEAIEHLEREE